MSMPLRIFAPSYRCSANTEVVHGSRDELRLAAYDHHPGRLAREGPIQLACGDRRDSKDSASHFHRLHSWPKIAMLQMFEWLRTLQYRRLLIISHTTRLGSLRHLVMSDKVDTGAGFRSHERSPNEQCHGGMRIFRLLGLSRMGYKSETKSLLFASSPHHTQLTQQNQANQTTPSSKPSISKHAVL